MKKNIKRSNKFITTTFLAGALFFAPVLSGCGYSGQTEPPVIQTIAPETQISKESATTSEAVPTPDVPETVPQSSVPETVPQSSVPQTTTAEPEPAAGQATAGQTAQQTAPGQLTLLMVGDILLHTPVEESAKQSDGSYDFDAVFAHTEDTIQSADLALVNQEVIIGGEALGISGYPAFNAPYAIGDSLVDAGFDVVCHATNHALDKGKKGIVNCSVYWRENHPQITVLGIHDSDPMNAEHDSTDRPVTFFEKNDITVAILNYTYGTNGISLPSDMPYAVDLLEEDRVIEDIRYAEENADFTIVCPHWGTEYRLTADSMQEKWTAIFLENGVDLVLGTHPHVIEPIEWVEDETTGHRMLVYYSLGNFVNWTSGTGAGVSNRMVGGMAEVTLSKISSDSAGASDLPASNDTVVISDYGVEAVVCHVTPGTDGVTVYPLSEYTPELSAENAILSQAPDFSKEYCVDLCNNVWGNQWH